MANVVKPTAYTAAIATILSTEMQNLANAGVSAASAAIDNGTNLNLLCDLTLTLDTQGVARSSGATVAVFRTQALDGTNYDTTNISTADLIATFSFDAATASRQATRRSIDVPPGLWKVFVLNSTGQALANTANNLLEIRYYNLNNNG